jgi:hypothetical protein
MTDGHKEEKNTSYPHITITDIFVGNETWENTRHISKDKGKAIPLQAWTGPKGSRKLRLPDFKRVGT